MTVSVNGRSPQTVKCCTCDVKHTQDSGEKTGGSFEIVCWESRKSFRVKSTSTFLFEWTKEKCFSVFHNELVQASFHL